MLTTLRKTRIYIRITMTYEETVALLRASADPTFREGMTRFGIAVDRALGVHVPAIRRLAKQAGCDHSLAMQLFASGIHEAQIMASMVADRQQFRPEDMDAWVADFDSWDVCDQCCMNLFRYVPYARSKVREYAAAEREFTRRAAFALLATLAVGDKRAENSVFTDFLPLVEEYSHDVRPSIRKAVNWALRQIGKRNDVLRLQALEVAQRIAASPVAAERWTGRDALRELTDPKVIARVQAKTIF